MTVDDFESASMQRVPASPSRNRLLAALFAALVGMPVTAGADEPGSPLVLTLEDLERVASRGKPGAPQRPGSDESGLTLIDPAAAIPPADHDSGQPAAAAPEADRVAPSWREEYFRLKALALRQAIARGEPVHFGDAPPGPAAASEAGDEPPIPTAGNRSCVYDRRGRLLHAPRGVACRPDQRQSQASRRAGEGACIYGLRGELLHAPPGRECDSP